MRVTRHRERKIASFPGSRTCPLCNRSYWKNLHCMHGGANLKPAIGSCYGARKTQKVGAGASYGLWQITPLRVVPLRSALSNFPSSDINEPLTEGAYVVRIAQEIGLGLESSKDER